MARAQLSFVVLTIAVVIFVPAKSLAVTPTLLSSSYLPEFDIGAAADKTLATAPEPKVESQSVIGQADQDSDYVNQWFGPWYLDITVYTEEQHSPLGPRYKGHVQITGHSKNSLTKWTIETYGRTVDVKTVNGIPPKITATNQLNEFPTTNSVIVETIKNETDSIDAAASNDLTQYSSDLISALSAMREAVKKLYGKLSGPSTCLPPDCFY